MVDNPEQGPRPQKAATGPATGPAPAGDAAAAKAQASQQKVSGLELVRFRNYFYRDGYRKSMTALLLSLLVNLALMAIVVFQFVSKPAPVYFATQTNGSLIEIQPLTEPLIAQETLLTWATRAAVTAYSFNFVDWQNDLNNAQQYFTATGFKNFVDALKASGNLDTVVAKRLVVQATVVDVPRIIQQGLIQGRYAWKIQIPMLVKYTSASENLRQPILVTILVARVPTTQYPQGIAIAQFVVQDRQEKL
ncbi:MAG: type IVB secretion system apparatus protein IcmL/DotI [Gammaproteobacteria bacterium]